MRKIWTLDWILIFASALIFGSGLLALYSLSTAENTLSINPFTRQIAFAIIAITTLSFFAFFDYAYLRAYSSVLYFATLVFLAGVFLWGATVRGTAGWLTIGPVHIQPVEFSKIFLIVFLAHFLASKREKLGVIMTIIASFVFTLIAVVFVLLQPDAGSAMILLGVWAGMTFVSGIPRKYLLTLLLIGIVTVASTWFFLAPYQRQRLITVVQPENDPRGAGYNAIQSMIAVGAGGFFGKGIGHGTQSQLNFLPEQHTDFVFAVITEESGLLGAIILLTLFFIVLYRLRVIAQSAKDHFGYFLVVGIMVMFFLQIFVNIGMNVGIFPVTGIPLPLVSYGGSSLVSVSIALGIALNVYRCRRSTSQMRIIESY